MDAHQPRRPVRVCGQALHQPRCGSSGKAPDLAFVPDLAAVAIENDIDAVRAMKVVGRHHSLHLTIEVFARRRLRDAFYAEPTPDVLRRVVDEGRVRWVVCDDEIPAPAAIRDTWQLVHASGGVRVYHDVGR